ncbi:hypothetical protein [Bradyrhizobium sp. WSM1417]|uniref:hypothetical protein n=1 Tax=Bradyrhizobium sp. WSM1417 TaxID=754500 RepID=UPI0012EC890F|nr:hypothetical protein [Bradyrhizobium sp. WSM1417]
MLATYQEIAQNFLEHRWEPSELNGGKFCEVVFSIISGTLSASYPASPSKPRDMKAACLALEQQTPNAARLGDRSLRILIPRMLMPLYEIRNNRGVGHAGGEVSPNQMDAITVYGMASWILAELIRIFHSVSIGEAQATVDALVERKLPLVWQLDEISRVLDTTLKASDQTLVLLYQSTSWASVDNLVKSVEYSGAAMFRTRVLDPLHKSRHIEHDSKNARARISPLGSKYVEEKILSAWRAQA